MLASVSIEKNARPITFKTTNERTYEQVYRKSDQKRIATSFSSDKTPVYKVLLKCSLLFINLIINKP